MSRPYESAGDVVERGSTRIEYGWRFTTLGQAALSPVVETCENGHEASTGHPLAAYLPLQGKVLPAVGMEYRADRTAILSVGEPMEQGRRERIDTGTIRGFKGIGVVRAFPVGDDTVPQGSQLPKTFLISRLGVQSYLVTSCTGYSTEDICVASPKPRCYGPALQIDVRLYDMQARSPLDVLLASHLHRHDGMTGGDMESLAYLLEPYITDSVYLHATGYGSV